MKDRIARRRAGTVRATTARKKVLNLLKAVSIGSGQGNTEADSEGLSPRLRSPRGRRRLCGHEDYPSPRYRFASMWAPGTVQHTPRTFLQSLLLRTPSVRPSCQGGYESDRLPGSLRHLVNHPLATWSAAVQPHHIGADCCLVDKDQMRGVKQALLSDPAPSCPSHVLSLPFRRLQAFF
jgi:hypothetical protein